MSVQAGRHAYLIMAHNHFYVLDKLLRLLDDPRNDLYIHIDQRIDTIDPSHYASLATRSGIFFSPNRMRVNWGGFSQIACELLLLKTASHHEYDYYHILSGVDLPLRSQDHIHQFFAVNRGREFIGFGSDDEEALGLVNHIQLFNEIGRGKHLSAVMAKVLRKGFVYVQKFVGYNRIAREKVTVRKGANWVSISHALAAYVVDHEEWIRSVFRHSLRCDEVLLQTLVWNSPFVDTVHSVNNEFESCMRHIDWIRGRPHTFRKQDYDELVRSDRLFARKFDESVDRDIIDMIFAHVSQLTSA